MAIFGCALMAPSWAQAQNRDPAAFREQQMTRMKESMGATDDEWKVLQPKIEKVMTAQRAMFAGRFGGGRGGRGGAGGGDADNTPQTPIAKASSELRATVQNKDASADEIKAKLAAYREARDKARAELQAAQKELKEVLTQRQEAVLVNSNMLD